SFESSNVIAKKDRDAVFAGDSACDVKNERNDFVVGRFDIAIVEQQKDQSRRNADAFVAVDKRMILNDVKEVGGRHFEDIVMEKLTLKGRLRLRESRLQQTHVADAH